MTQSSVEKTLQSLMEAIITGEFHNGLPPQEVLALRYNVSRTVLREAISKLEYSNIVVARPKTGSKVTPREQWKLLNPLVVDSYFKSMPNRKRLHDVLTIFGDVGGSAASSVSNRLSRNEIIVPEYDDTYLSAVKFQHWVFQESSNSIIAQFAPMIRDMLLNVAPLIDTTANAPVMHHLRTIYWTTTGRWTPNISNDLHFAYDAARQVIASEIHLSSIQAA